MVERMLVGTGGGLWMLAGDTATAIEPLAGRAVTALARERDTEWAIVDGTSLWQSQHGAWTQCAAIAGPPATVVASTPVGVVVGTEQAHLLRLAGDRLVPIDSFETTEGRGAWYTPWGDPADVRSIGVGGDGAIHVNVHVGGVARSRDGGTSWTPTMDIENDVHQVLAHPARPEIVLVASAEGFGLSRDGGDSWQLSTTGPARSLPARSGGRRRARPGVSLGGVSRTALGDLPQAPRRRHALRTVCRGAAEVGSTTTSTPGAWPPTARSSRSAPATAVSSARVTPASTGSS